MDHDDTRGDELVATLTPYVMTVLAKEAFFEQLDDLLCPRDPAQKGKACQGTYALTTQLLTDLDLPSEAIADVIAVLASQGGSCDCEVLFNAAPESRLRSQYWQKRATELQISHHHKP